MIDTLLGVLSTTFVLYMFAAAGVAVGCLLDLKRLTAIEVKPGSFFLRFALNALAVSLLVAILRETGALDSLLWYQALLGVIALGALATRFLPIARLR